jgi:hypothetical protein
MQDTLPDKEIESNVKVIRDILILGEGKLKLPQNVTKSIFEALVAILARNEKDFIIE